MIGVRYQVDSRQMQLFFDLYFLLLKSLRLFFSRHLFLHLVNDNVECTTNLSAYLIKTNIMQVLAINIRLLDRLAVSQ